MKIGFITTSFPTFPQDFAGNFVFHMAEGFARRGYQIDVVVPAPAPCQPTTWTTREVWPPWLTIHPVSYMRPASLQQLFFANGTPENIARSLWKALLIPPAVHHIWNTVDSVSSEWSAVISHWLLPSALIATRIPRRRLPHLAVSHSGDVHLLQHLPARSVFAAAIAGGATAVSFVSAQLKNEFSSLLPTTHPYQRRLHVNPMGIPSITTVINKADARKKYATQNKFTVLYVGRLAPIKGVDQLIRAAQIEPFQLIIAGKGDSELQLRRECEHRNVSAVFLGPVSAEMRNELFQAVDVVAVPSISLPNGRHEGIPMIIGEAMAAGVPVVASRSGGISELVHHGTTGLLVSPGDVVSLCDAIVALKNNPTLARTLQQNAQTAIGHRRWENIVPRYEDLLFNVE